MTRQETNKNRNTETKFEATKKNLFESWTSVKKCCTVRKNKIECIRKSNKHRDLSKNDPPSSYEATLLLGILIHNYTFTLISNRYALGLFVK